MFVVMVTFVSFSKRCMRALGKTWHPEHFFCTLCGKHFGSEGFHEKDGRAYCRECYYEKFAPRCKRCSKAIMEGFVSALGSQWHTECFCCKVKLFSFPVHFYQSFGLLCLSLFEGVWSHIPTRRLL